MTSPARFASIALASVFGLVASAACGDGATGPGEREPAFALESGGFHTCRLDDGGALVCWGRNDSGQLAVPIEGQTCTVQGTAVPCRDAPSEVAAEPRFARVSAGEGHTCGVTSEGAGFCWGNNFIGQLGTTEPLATCTGPFGSGPCSVAPVPVAGGRVFSRIEAGYAHTCGLTQDGTAYCWGSNTLQQLGVPRGGEPYRSAVPVAVQTELRFTSLALGAAHTCALTAEGAAYCWGAAREGRLGAPGTGEHCSGVPCTPTPQPVQGGHRFRALVAGGAHTCGLTQDGRALCWGSNTRGQLGIGPGSFAAVPTGVQGDLTFSQLAAGALHTCGIAEEGNAYCWGFDQSDQLGSGRNHFIDVADRPFPVVGQHTFVRIAAGVDFTCAATARAETFCWGSGVTGQLGTGTTESSATPAAVAG